MASVAFSDLTSTPTTIAGYGITDAVEDFADSGVTPTTISTVTELQMHLMVHLVLTSKSLQSCRLWYYRCSSRFCRSGTTPTTLAGYGITDAVASSGGNISLADDEKLIPIP